MSETKDQNNVDDLSDEQIEDVAGGGGTYIIPKSPMETERLRQQLLRKEVKVNPETGNYYIVEH
ncbi:MAG: hypothetical protein Q4B54_14715 [Coriobacteriales bacterium]|nr:hypothetical protein [Coriobacteriales bacterium]